MDGDEPAEGSAAWARKVIGEKLDSSVGRGSLVGSGEPFQESPVGGSHDTVIGQDPTVLAVNEIMEKLAKQRRHALRRIEQGLYGVCEGCGEGIDPERLVKNPEATRCVRCQASYDGSGRRSY